MNHEMILIEKGGNVYFQIVCQQVQNRERETKPSYFPIYVHSPPNHRHMHVLFLKWILSITLLFLLNTTYTENVLGKLLVETSVELVQRCLVHQGIMLLLDHLY